MQWINRLNELSEDWYYLMQQEGLSSALPVIGRELSYLPYRYLKFVLVARSLLEPLPDLKAKIELDIREFRETDVDLVRQIERPSQANLCRERLQRKEHNKGFMAFHQGQPAGYAWACDKVEPAVERIYLDLEPGDMVCAYSYTAPAFRSKGIQKALLLERLRLYKNLGFRRALAFVEVSNHPSLAALRRIQFEVIGRLNFRRIGLWRQTTYSPDDYRNGH